MAEPKFHEKDTVVDSRDPNRRGQISKIEISPRGKLTYRVNFDGEEGDIPMIERYLKPVFDVQNVFDRCRQHIYGTYQEFTQLNTTFKIQHSNNNTISSLKASKTEFKAYQFKPLLKFMNSDNRRLLIADEVGLGKTIEAGHIMLELHARKELKNVIIACPKSLKPKWKAELEEKFGLPFRIVENATEAINELRMHDGRARIIITYDGLSGKDKDTSLTITEYLAEKGKSISLVLCDEAHHLRNKNNRNKAVTALMEFAKAGVFLTATPIMLGEENLFNLLNILDPAQYDDLDTFRNSLTVNRPFLQALESLKTKKELPKIAEELCSTEFTEYFEINEQRHEMSWRIDEYFSDSPLFKRIIHQMKHDQDTLQLRATLQFDLNAMSQINNIFSRTRKREVTVDWTQTERVPHTHIVELNEQERIIFDNVLNQYEADNSYIDDYGEIKLTRGGSLGLTTRKRQVSSSVWADQCPQELLDKGVNVFAEIDDTKVNHLRAIIREVKNDNEHCKLIVFAIFKKTLKYVQLRLQQYGIKSLLIDGDTEDRRQVLEDFRDNDEIEVLLSSEVGGEGLDMQFCNTIVNFDLPWNPMVVEQRIGRVDRFGQKSEVVNIYNLVIKDSIQEDIYNRLLMRIGIFRNSIGDLEAILDKELELESGKKRVTISQLCTTIEDDFYRTSLTDSERIRKIDEIAQAVENEKEQIKKIEEGLSNALTNDSYFRNEIERIRNNNAYVTENELYSYVCEFIEKNLTTCKLLEQADGIFDFKLPASNPQVLIKYLRSCMPLDEDNDMLFNQFIHKIAERTVFPITFKQDCAYNHGKVDYMNIYHPIIQGCMCFFAKNKDKTNRTFKFRIPSSIMGDYVRPGQYYLAVYEVSTSKIVFGAERTQKVLKPVVFDISTEQVVNNEMLADKFFGKAQSEGEYLDMGSNQMPDSDIISEMESSLTEYIEDFCADSQEDQRVRHEAEKAMKIKQMKSRYKSKRDQVQNRLVALENKIEFLYYDKEHFHFMPEEREKIDAQIKNLESQALGAETRIKNLGLEEQEELERLMKDPEIKVRNKCVSLNLVLIE